MVNVYTQSCESDGAETVSLNLWKRGSCGYNANTLIFLSALYAHKIPTGLAHNVSNPEEFGFAS
jgi:hypothetical protein